LPAHTSFSKDFVPQSSACSDYSVVDKSSLSVNTSLTYGSPAPWSPAAATVYRSSTVTAYLAGTVTSGVVPGLGITYGRVFEVLYNNGCWVLIKGGAVRDVFLGLAAADVDIILSCSTTTVSNIISAQGWECGSTCNGPIFTIGSHSTDSLEDEEDSTEDDDDYPPLDTIDGITWNYPSAAGPFSSLEAFEYTANCMFFDTINNVIIDTTGNGLSDSCSRTIRIPAGTSSWNQWVTSAKAVRYWKLRAAPKSFFPANGATQTFVFNFMENSWSTPDFLGQTTQYWTSKLLCTKGVHGQYVGGVCLAPCPIAASDSTRVSELIAAFAKDLGVFYNTTIAPLTHIACSASALCSVDIYMLTIVLMTTVISLF